jgi:nucleoside phosphorylase
MPRHLKRAMLAELTDEKLRALLAAHIERGIAGSVSSARLVLEYAVGKPRERVDVDVTARGALWQFIQEVRTARDDPQVIEATAPDEAPLND